MIGNEIIYQIFTRNYSPEGTFESVRKDLQRIKDLGVDIVYLTPIHPISEKERKGTCGSPYAIKDYFAIEPSYGTIDDFKHLIRDVHSLGMKIIIDMVFNHTGRDNVLLTTHPEYYFYKNGKLGNRVGDWSDIVDLDTSRDDTQEYLLSVLKYWRNVGVDGYRFDVASMIPFIFFKKAREALGKEVIFIGESIDYDFATYLRSISDNPTPDKKMYEVFDALYNYSWFRTFDKYLNHKVPIDDLVKALNDDSKLLKDVGVRLNCLENHDTERIALKEDKDKLDNVTGFLFHLKGMVFIYMGQECELTHRPNLFERDPVELFIKNASYGIYKELIKEKKKQPLNIYQTFEKADESTIKVVTYKNDEYLEERVFRI